MAQERDSMNPSSETDEIRSEIERTRVEMSETLGEIQDRLRPDHLLQQARDGVADAATGKVKTMMQSAGETAQAVASRARDTGNYLSRYAQEHPVRVALAVGAVTWWMLRNRYASDDYYGANDTSWDDSEAMDYGQRRSLRDRAGEYASTARETVGEYAATARDAAGQYASTAREAVGEYAQSARVSARRAQEATADWVTDNPMAAGAIALAVGAAIGMSLPSTDYEDRVMGEKRDRAWERASAAARDLKNNVTQKVQSAAETLAVDSVMGPQSSSNEPLGRA